MYGTTVPYGMAQASSNPAPTPPTPATLVSAISASSNLIDRLANLGNALEGLAMRIGGPWPVESNGGHPPKESGSAIGALCDNLDAAHRLVSHMEGSLKAMSRVLEG